MVMRPSDLLGTKLEISNLEFAIDSLLKEIVGSQPYQDFERRSYYYYVDLIKAINPTERLQLEKLYEAAGWQTVEILPLGKGKFRIKLYLPTSGLQPANDW